MAAIDPDVAAIQAGVEQHQRGYLGLKFEYSVTSVEEGKPQVNSRDVFKLMQPTRRDSRQMWRSWERRVEQGGEWVIDRFYAVDGEKMVGYKRNDFSVGHWNEAAIHPVRIPDEFQLNIFDAFLCRDLAGLPAYYDPHRTILPQLLERYQFVVEGSREVLGRGAWVLRGKRTDADVELEVHVTKAPEFLIVFSQMIQDGVPAVSEKVTRIGQFGSVTYPAAGEYRRPHLGLMASLSYDFSVEKVERLRDAARQDWFPDWPPGTYVLDHVNESALTIAPTEAQLRLLHESELAGLQQPGVGRRWFFLVVNLVGIAVFVFVAWKLWTRRSAPRSQF